MIQKSAIKNAATAIVESYMADDMRGFYGSLEHLMLEADGHGITFVDIDETLFWTFAKIKVLDSDGKVKHELTNVEYNHYRLQDGESFDFGQFKDAEFFAKTSKANQKMMVKVNSMLKAIEARGGQSEIHMLTARGRFDTHTPFFNAFRKAGMRVDEVGFIPTGDAGFSSTADAKKHFIREKLRTGKFNRCRLFDDAIHNLAGFMALQKEFPHVTFQAYWIDHYGNPKVWRAKGAIGTK